MSAPFKMKGFSGFGNSPLNKKPNDKASDNKAKEERSFQNFGRQMRD